MPDEPGAQRPRCPFYGFHWPEHNSRLIDTGTSECGLDFTNHGPCKMAAADEAVDFYRCDLPRTSRNLLLVGAPYIRFYPAGLSQDGIAFETWRDLTTRPRVSASRGQ